MSTTPQVGRPGRPALVILSLLIAAATAPNADARQRPAIIATLGPSARDAATIGKLAAANATVLRINLSHVGRRDQLLRLVRAAREGAGAAPLLFDLPGAKARIGPLAADAPLALRAGDAFTIQAGRTGATDRRGTSVSYAGLAKQVGPGQRLLLGDREVVLDVRSVAGSQIRTRVVQPGRLRGRIGIAIEGADLDFPPVVAADRRKLKMLAAIQAELGDTPLSIGASMVRHADGIEALRSELRAVGLQRARIVAKIETHAALEPERLAGIIRAADETMVARGDLKTAVGARRLPAIQRRIVATAQQLGRPVIVATGFLSGMLGAGRPTAANRADVARALAQKVDAIMLNETAIGPAEATVRQLSQLLAQPAASAN